MAKKMLIDATHPEETRVVVVDGNKVEDFDFESLNRRQLAGNIYLAKVTRVEPSLQAAFIEYGGNRHGFLAFSEIHPDYYQIPVADREALLAEEAREEEAERAREEERDTGKPRRSRGRAESGRTRPEGGRKPRRNSVSGLEVIDIDAPGTGAADAGEVPRGLEVADTGPSEDEVRLAASREAVAEPALTGDPAPAAPNGPEEVADDRPSSAPAADEESPTPAEAADDAVEPGTEQDPARTVGRPDMPDRADELFGGAAAEDEQADDDDAGDGSPPRSMAESAGLGDGERLSEEISETAGESAENEHADGERPRNDDRTAERPAAPAQAQDAAEMPAEAAEAAAMDTSAEDAELVAEPAGATEPGAEAAQTADDGAEQADTGRRRRRRRRGRDERSDTSEPGATDAAAEPATARGNGSRNGEGNGDDQEVEQPEQIGAEDTLEEAARVRARLRRRYKIQDVIKVRQIMLVQVVKEERGNKGAALTTYLSLAGRYCVLMPNTARGGGISRKITNVTDRKRLREIANELDVPRGMGLIVRTAGAERTRAEIKRDYEFLLRQWEQIRELTLKSVAPTLIYEEGSLIKRSIRDLYSKEIDQILVEGEAGYREAKEYMKMLMPSHAKNVQPYAEPIPLFGRYQVESYLNGMFNPKVQLKSGGYIVIGITEALVAIDVNSGRATKQGSIEETALQTNLEAAEEVARQLRLRDLAGLIVIDFIDMDENRNNRAVEKRLKEKLKNDRARIQLGRISAFGLLEMSRQRLRPGMLEATTKPCPHCHGMGLIRSDDSLALAILRDIEDEALRGRSDEITVRAPVDIANYLINVKRRHIGQIETRNNVSVLVVGDPGLVSPDYEVERSKGERKRPAPAARDVVSSATVVLPHEIEEAEEVEERAADRADRADGGDRQGDDDRSRRRRGRRGGRRRRGENGEDRETRQADAERQPDERQAEQRDDRDDRSEGGDDDRPRGRRSRNRRRRGRRGDEQEQRAKAGREQDAAPAASTAGERESAAVIGGAETASPEAISPAPATGGTPLPAAEAPADVAGLDAAVRGDASASAATAVQPEELNAGDGSTAAAEQDTEGASTTIAGIPAAGEAPRGEPQAGDGATAAAEQHAQPPAAPADAGEQAPPTDDRPEELHGGDGSTPAAEQDREPAQPPQSGSDQPSEEPRPKKRGWWSLGF